MRWKTAVFVCLVLALLAWPALAGTPKLKPAATQVIYPTATAESPAFRDLPVVTPEECQGEPREVENFMVPKGKAQPYAPGEIHEDTVLQSRMGSAPMPTPLISFEGINNTYGVYPPDTEGDIGPDHYVQWVNLGIQGWSIDRSTWSATTAFGPVNGNTIWTPLGGPCATQNDGDPIVLWDRFRSRWVISQFAVEATPFRQAIAVSKTADPSGGWWLYCYDWSATQFNDYPKFGVWPDGYYMTVNQFNSSGTTWLGAGVAVLEADKMINGDPTARMLKVDIGAVNLNWGSLLPAHFEGMNNPPAGSPGYFVEVDDSTWIAGLPADTISLWRATVNWVAGTFTVGTGGNPDLQMSVADFTPLPCVGVTRNCIPQPGTSQKLDSIGDRAMYRLQYRNYGSYQSMVFNHTVMADVSGDRAGVRWYELRKDGGHPDWYVYQQGTFGPTDGKYRWMGSAAQDHVGNFSIGYSISDGTSTYPSIGYAGRLAGDPLGTLPQSEVTLHAGTGYQSGTGARWGDYSTLSIDPVDDCTFWYTQEYIQTNGTAPWRTRIGAWKFANCSIGPTGTLTGTVSASAGGTPIVGATVSAFDGVNTIQTITGAGGIYTLTLPVATYSVTASAFGYNPQTVNGVVITNGGTTTQDFSLTSAASHTVDGTVTDAGTGWPLYATISVTGDGGYPGATIYTNPADGYYSITLVDGVTYSFTVTPWVSGYTPGTATVGPLAGNVTQNFALVADTSACNAPGYHLDYKWFTDLEGGNGGFTVSGTAPSWAYGVPTSGPGSAHSPTHVWATNLGGNYNTSENSYLTSPVIDLSAYAGNSVILEWWQWLQTESGYDYASVEATSDGVTWNVVYGTVSGSIDSSWTKHSVVLGATYATANFRFRFHLTSDGSINYPGWYVDDVGVAALAVAPPPPPLLSENFEGTFPPAGWSTVDHIGTGNVWHRNDFFGKTNNTGGSGYCADADSDAVCATAWDTSLVSPSVSLPAGATSLTFKSNFQDYAGAGEAWCDISTDGGSNWTNLFYTSVDEPSGGTSHTISLAPYVSTTAIFRWRYSDNGDGCAWYWRIDDVVIPDPATPPPPTVQCVAPAGGGLIYGNVYDANTLAALSGATVSNATTGGTSTTAVTPDPNVDDGFYCMYGAEGANTMSATKTLYGTDNQSATVPHYGVVQRDFHLATGHLTATPSSLSWTTAPGGTGGTTVTLNNIGGADATFSVKELSGHVAKPTNNLFTFFRPRVTKGEMLLAAFKDERESEKAREGEKEDFEKQSAEKKQEEAKGKLQAAGVDARSRRTGDVAVRPAPASAPRPSGGKLAPGDVIASWATGLAVPWGIAFDGGDNTVWVGDPGPSWGGSNKMYEYSPAGVATGRSYDFTWTHSSGPGDFAYNWNTGMIWVLNINTGVNNCIYEVDPATGPTGNSICPGGGTGFATSERGLAYDPFTDTYFAGGWNTLTITHFDSSGAILDSAYVGLSISGLAYNPMTGHLFAIENSSSDTVTVLDANNNYSVVGSFTIPGFGNYSGAGLEIDCQGNLWAANQVDLNVYEVSSGEVAALCDIPWLDENPKTGSVAAGGSADVDVTYDATGLAPGVYEATVSFANNTPYGPLNVPVTLTVVEPVVPVATADVTSGTAPLTVNFTGTATGGIGTYSYDWNFGDGSPHSTAQNPSHTYNIGGSFTVTLTVTASVMGSGVDNHLVITVAPPPIPVVNNFYDDLPRNLEQACFNRLTGAYVWTVLSGPHAGTVFTGTASVYNGGAKFTNKPADPNKFSVVYDPVKHKASGWLISGGVYYPLSDSNTLNNPAACY